MSEKDGGPAFPIAPVFHSPGLGLEVWTTATAHPGMSLRDWFAGQALAGWIARGAITDIRAQLPTGTAEEAIPILASGCYAVADAMLQAREAQP